MGTISQLIFTFLLNALWQVALIGGAAWAGTRLLQGTAEKHRHKLYVFALLLCLAVPLTSLYPGTANRFEGRPTTSAVSVSRGANSSRFNELSVPNGMSNTRQLVTKKTVFLGGTWILALGVLYAIFLACRIWQFAGALRQLRQTRTSGDPREIPAWMALEVARCAKAIGVQDPLILYAPSRSGPVTIGTWRRSILLPATL